MRTYQNVTILSVCARTIETGVKKEEVRFYECLCWLGCVRMRESKGK